MPRMIWTLRLNEYLMYDNVDHLFFLHHYVLHRSWPESLDVSVYVFSDILQEYVWYYLEYYIDMLGNVGWWAPGNKRCSVNGSCHYLWKTVPCASCIERLSSLPVCHTTLVLQYMCCSRFCRHSTLDEDERVEEKGTWPILNARRVVIFPLFLTMMRSRNCSLMLKLFHASMLA